MAAAVVSGRIRLKREGLIVFDIEEIHWFRFNE